MTNFLFKLLFPGQYAHMQHLIDDVVRLEREQKFLACQFESDSTTEYLEAQQK